MENYKTIYVLILLQAVLLGVVLFFGQTLFPVQATGGWGRETTLKGLADELFYDYLSDYQKLPPSSPSRLAGFLVAGIDIVEYDEREFVFSAKFSVKPHDPQNSDWITGGPVNANGWITDRIAFVVAAIDESGRYRILSVSPGL